MGKKDFVIRVRKCVRKGELIISVGFVAISHEIIFEIRHGREVSSSPEHVFVLQGS